jgi:hypothetical protein
MQIQPYAPPARMVRGGAIIALVGLLALVTAVGLRLAQRNQGLSGMPRAVPIGIGSAGMVALLTGVVTCTIARNDRNRALADHQAALRAHGDGLTSAHGRTLDVHRAEHTQQTSALQTQIEAALAQRQGAMATANRRLDQLNAARSALDAARTALTQRRDAAVTDLSSAQSGLNEVRSQIARQPKQQATVGQQTSVHGLSSRIAMLGSVIAALNQALELLPEQQPLPAEPAEQPQVQVPAEDRPAPVETAPVAVQDQPAQSAVPAETQPANGAQAPIEIVAPQPQETPSARYLREVNGAVTWFAQMSVRQNWEAAAKAPQPIRNLLIPMATHFRTMMQPLPENADAQAQAAHRAVMRYEPLFDERLNGFVGAILRPAFYFIDTFVVAERVKPLRASLQQMPNNALWGPTRQALGAFMGLIDVWSDRVRNQRPLEDFAVPLAESYQRLLLATQQMGTPSGVADARLLQELRVAMDLLDKPAAEISEKADTIQSRLIDPKMAHLRALQAALGQSQRS